jgi:hypothetical protein
MFFRKKHLEERRKAEAELLATITAHRLMFAAIVKTLSADQQAAALKVLKRAITVHVAKAAPSSLDGALAQAYRDALSAEMQKVVRVFEEKWMKKL